MQSEIIGMMAGFITTICFIPQAIKVLKAEDTKSISLVMYCLFTTGVSLWLAYGIMINSLSIIIWNGLTIPLSLTILCKKIHNIRKGVD